MPSEQAHSGDQTGWYPYVVLFTSLYLMVAGTGSIYLLVAALKPIAAEFGWPRAVPSIAYALQYVGGGSGGILMGYWLDRAGMAKPACLGGVMIGLGAICTYGVQHPWQLYAIYGLMMGLAGRATLFSPLMVNITHWFEDRRGMAVGIVGGGQAIAGATWPRIFQEGIATVGWRETSLLYGVFVLLTMVPLSMVFLRERTAPNPAAKSSVIPGASTVAAYPMPARTLVILLCTAIVGCCVAMSLPLAHLLSHASDIGFTPTHGAQLLAVMLVCAAFSSMVGLGVLSSRLGSLGALMVFSGMQALTVGLFPLAETLPGLYVVAALFGFGYGGVLPSYPVIIREHTRPQGAGARTGLVVFFGTIGMATGSGLGGFSYDVMGSYAPAFYVGVVFNFANLAIIGYLIARVRRARRAQAGAGSLASLPA
ncbi:MAG: MFS family permease [Gammaproteobacteria bacterium]|jgi:MFS family permease